MANDSQIVRAKENPELSYGGPSQRQPSCTNQRSEVYVRAVIESEVWPTVVQLKRKQKL